MGEAAFVYMHQACNKILNWPRNKRTDWFSERAFKKMSRWDSEIEVKQVVGGFEFQSNL